MAQALKVVEDSMRKMQEMLAAARDSSNALKGISPEILDICKELMGLIRLLILDATSLQESVVAAGNTGLSPAEFYHKNSRWTDGLISAAKAVGWVSFLRGTRCVTTVTMGVIDPIWWKRYV